MREERKTGAENLSENFSEIFNDAVADFPQSQESVVSAAERRYELAKREQALREKDEELARLRELHGMRKKYLIALFSYLCAWSLVTAALVFADGLFSAFEMSDAVEVTLLTTTLAQVLGLTAIAFNWLFPREGK